MLYEERVWHGKRMNEESTQRGRALIVDDDAEMRKLLGFVMRRGGFTVDLAEGGEQALTIAAETQPDVVVTDLHMPGMGGVELLRALRARSPDLPVLVLTASGGVASAVEAMREGAEDYLTKPVDPHALRFAIDRAIERRRQRAETDVLRRTLAELREAHGALSAERDFVSAVLDTIESLVVVLDTEGKILSFNRACERVTGYSEQEMLAVELIPQLVSEDEAEGVRGVFEALASGEVRRNTYENHWCTKEGERRRITWTNTVLLDDAGNVKNIVATGLDVTEAREMEARVRRTEHLASLATFSAGVAHEIRNPLNAATLHLTLLGRLLKGREPDLEGAREAAGIASSEILRVSQLLQDFLQFARPIALRRGPADLRRICDDIAALCSVEASASGVEIMVTGDAAIEANVDEQRLRQVLLNLVRNAMEAVGSGGHVRIDVVAEGRRARLRVEDDGPGLAADEVRIFQPFFTTKEKGTGLGLAITHRIVTDHGGDISVESRPGRTIFTITLPFEDPVGVA